MRALISKLLSYKKCFAKIHFNSHIILQYYTRKAVSGDYLQQKNNPTEKKKDQKTSAQRNSSNRTGQTAENQKNEHPETEKQQPRVHHTIVEIFAHHAHRIKLYTILRFKSRS